jgi:hypothetical protein
MCAICTRGDSYLFNVFKCQSVQATNYTQLAKMMQAQHAEVVGMFTSMRTLQPWPVSNTAFSAGASSLPALTTLPGRTACSYMHSAGLAVDALPSADRQETVARLTSSPPAHRAASTDVAWASLVPGTGATHAAARFSTDKAQAHTPSAQAEPSDAAGCATTAAPADPVISHHQHFLASMTATLASGGGLSACTPTEAAAFAAAAVNNAAPVAGSDNAQLTAARAEVPTNETATFQQALSAQCAQSVKAERSAPFTSISSELDAAFQQCGLQNAQPCKETCVVASLQADDKAGEQMAASQSAVKKALEVKNMKVALANKKVGC